ncbi:GEVED domain-containing protein, partial [Hymenobacter negativus]
MKHSYFFTSARFGRRSSWLALLWLLCCGTAAVAQPTTYCTSNLGAYCGTGNANINGVAISSTTLNNPNTICNTVNGSGYTLFPTAGSTTGTLLRGLTYQVSVTTPEAGIISVWFDWNQDGLFDASEWTQVATASTAGTPATIGVTVPVTATLGLTGMRVRSRLSGNTNGAADACASFGSGETEDYTVTIGAAPACAPPAGLTATNITTNGATLGFATTTNGTATNYIVQYGPNNFTPGGTGSTTVNTTTTSTNISGLTANTTYQFYVTKDCGGGQTSQVAGPFTFRTACVAPTYASLPVSESFESTWVGICDTQDSPSAFWRNTPVTGNNSWRREDDGASAAWTSPTVGAYTPAGSQGTHSARFHSYYAPAGALGTLDLYVNLSASGNKVLQFDYLNTAGNDSLQVQVSTDGGNTFSAPLIRLGVSGTVAQGWQPQSVSLTATAATTAVRFRTKVTGTFTSDIGLDNVRINLLSGVPSCATNITPAAGAVNQARNTSLTWQAGTGVVTGYDVYFGTTTTPPLVSTNQPGTTYTAPALLAAGTTYYYQIVPRNANGPAVGCGVQSFSTNSVPVYCNPSNTALGGFCGGNDITQVTLGGSGLNATGLTCNTVTTSAGTSYYTSYPVAGTTTGTVLQGLNYSLGVTVSGSSIISVWADWNQNGTFEASEWTQVATTSPSGTPATVTITVPATAVQGLTGLRIRSRGTGNTNGAGDACSNFGSGETKDFVLTVGPAPSCAPPTALLATNVTTTTATLTFSGATNGTATGYIVQYGLNNFTPGGTGSTTVNTTTTSTNISGLTANTTYQFYVTKNCGGGQTSQTAGPFTFTTLCLAPVYATLPVTQSFENAWVDGCGTHDIPTTSWRNTPVTGDNSWRRDDDGTTAAWTSPTFGLYTPVASQGTHSARFHTYYAPSGSIGSLDLFVNLSLAGAKRLSFDYVNTSGTDSLVVLLSTDGGTTFSRLAGYGISGTIAAGFITQVLPISATSATAVIRFRAKGDFGVTDIGLDNVILESATGCLTPASLTATTTTTTASLSWLAGGTGTYTVLYGPTGFNPAQTSSPTNVYTTVTGLTGPPYAVSGLTPGTTYQFYVTSNCGAGTNSGTAGPQSFTTLIVNDNPCGATVLTINNTCTPLSTTTFGATTTATSVYATGGQGAGCGSITAPRDVWFTFTTAATGPTSTAVRISVTG